MDIHPKMSEQIKLEAEMRSVTVDRYFKTHEKAAEDETYSDTHAGRALFDHLYSSFLEGIETWIEERKTGKAGRRPKALKMIEEFADNKTLAYIFLRHLINQVMNSTSKKGFKLNARKTRVVLKSTLAIHDELRIRYFAKERKQLLRRIIKDFEQRDLPRRRRRDLIIRQFNSQKLEWQAEGWGQSERVNLGLVLLDILKKTTGVVEEYRVYSGIKTIDCLALTPKMLDALGDKMEAASNMFTLYYPMVVPPRPWTNDALIGGGYYTEDVTPYRFVKGSSQKFTSELENTDLSDVLEPINALQETPWSVNPVILDVLHDVYSRNVSVKGLPTADPLEIPAPPSGIEEDEDAAAEYRKQCYITHDTNRRMISKRIAVLRTISVAQRFSKYEELYFPYDVDSRGRTYPKVPFLNPQGPDYVKALLEFAEGKPIETEEHAAYLAVAVANAWGQDKLPLQERVNWVQDNEEMLLEVARDPKGDLRWTRADEPFMALRGALEWLGLAEQGPGYMSHMPVHFDATCSGLQHFSALLKDPVGGFHVNLTGSEDRQDIYAVVAKKAEESLSVLANTSHIAKIALELGVSRSLCKRPVMIVPYAGTFSACMTYVFDHYKERAEEGEVFPVPLETIRQEVSPLVAKHVWEAISNTVIAAREAMDWITKVARIASSKGQLAPIMWTTPDGFTVQQAKYEEKIKKVATFLDGSRRVEVRVAEDTRVLDARKMSQSLSPNYIHSLDACHMRMSINKALDIGGMSFAMIHDSFGVHAVDMPRFCEECIKPSFVEMYEQGERLDRFRDELLLNVREEDLDKVPPLPVKGSLDVQEVLQSQFFFS